MNKTSISWVRNPDGTSGFSWNPMKGCQAISPGCANCWAASLASTRLTHLPQYTGLAKDGKWTGEVRFFPKKLAEPLRRRKPSRIFVDDMSDLFHESVTNEQIAAVFGVMAACPQHKFYVPTKRAKRMRKWFEWVLTNSPTKWTDWIAPFLWAHVVSFIVAIEPVADLKRSSWPLSNVLIGVTVENQAAADERIPELLQTPAACRFLSMEPLLEPVDLCDSVIMPDGDALGQALYNHGEDARIDWVICGSESGSKARPCNIEWIRSILTQCKDAGVPCFVKQMSVDGKLETDPIRFPEDLRRRELPHGT